MSQEEMELANANKAEAEAEAEEGEVVMSSGEVDPETGVLLSTRDVEEKREANRGDAWREQK